MNWLDEAPDLLEAARAALRGEVMPAVAPERRYEAAMVANAIGIAAREVRQGAAAREAERAELAAFCGEGSAASLDDLRRRLRRDLRAGSLDAAAEARLRGLLLAAVRRRLAISNPDHLARQAG
jgi:hypothetical protein